MKKNLLPHKKIKISFVSDAIYPYNKGGKEKRIFEVSTRLANKGYDVHIYCMKWWKDNKKTHIENKVTLHAISPLYPLYAGQRRSIRQALFFSLHCFKLLREDFDILEVDHMPHLVIFPLKLVCMLKQKKLFVTWNEVWGRAYWKKYLGSLGEIAYLIELMSIQIPDTIISISAHTTEKIAQDLNRKKEVYTVPIGIDIKQLEKISPSKKKSNIIFAGRLLENKNVDYLIKSVALITKKLPKVKCIIVGNGPEKLKLEKLVEKLRLKTNIIFYNFLENHNELYSLMKSSDVFVFPSSREGFGIVVLEANACGLPVITVNSSDNAAKSLITRVNGVVCDLDVKTIANEVIMQLSRKKTEDDKYSYQESIRKYDWNSVISSIQKVYAQ